MADKNNMEDAPKGISRRSAIKGVIAAGAFRPRARTVPHSVVRAQQSARRLRRAPDHSERQWPAATRRRDEAGNAGQDAALQARAHRHQAGMRPRRMRRLHGPDRRCAALFVLDAHPYTRGKKIVTIEGLAAPDGTLHPVQQGVIDEQGFQCAFCMSGFIMATVGFLKTNPNPDAGGAGARHFRQPVPVPGLRQDPHRDDAGRGEPKEVA